MKQFLTVVGFLLGFAFKVWTQTIVHGYIRETGTNEPIPFASVAFPESRQGATSGADGHYYLRTTAEVNYLQVNCVGYQSRKINIKPGISQEINISLEPEALELKEVKIKAQKVRYRNKDNPAVELIRRVIDNKKINRPEEHEFYEYEKYEKIEFALSEISEKLREKKVMKKISFVFENSDTTKLAGREVVPVYLKESISDVYFRKDPVATKELVKASKMVNIDNYLSREGMTHYFKYLYQDIDIYENNIMLLTNQFVSPVANQAPVFYKYFITDTVDLDGKICFELSFSPRNKTDFLFQGKMYITADSATAVRRINMSIHKDINLNWVKELQIDQDFDLIDGIWQNTREVLSVHLGINATEAGVFGRRTVSRKKQVLNRPHEPSFYRGESVVTLPTADTLNNTYWAQNRHENLSRTEEATYQVVDSIQRVPLVKKMINLAVILTSGYKGGKYFEFGPLAAFYSFNPQEGYRFRVGGRTTPQLSKRINLEGYGAYGLLDERMKYYAGVTYSLTPRTIWEFPVKSIKVSYQHDTRIPGQELQFVQEDNFFLSFKRGVNDKWLYNTTFRIDHLNEFRNRFSYSVGFKYLRQEPAGGLHFSRSGYLDESAGSQIPFLTTSEFSVQLRYAPGEQFYQGRVYRMVIANPRPVYRLRYSRAFKGLAGGEFSYQYLSASFYKRIWMSPIGYADMTIEGGRLWGSVPYPLLIIHRANQTYAYQSQSYNLMNFLEFVSDKFVSLNYDHNFNGAILNKIPLIKRLGWREVFSAKVLYGGLSAQNHPDNNPDLFKFPVDNDGNLSTFGFNGMPYVEGSIGLANLFRFLRVDLVRRFTYLNNPGISETGVRFKFKFDF